MKKNIASRYCEQTAPRYYGRESRPTADALAVLNALAARVNPVTRKGFIDVSSLAADTGMTPRSVLQVVETLQTERLIETRTYPRASAFPNSLDVTILSEALDTPARRPKSKYED
jgi:hypothetical protein